MQAARRHQQAIREAIEGRWAPVREALADMVNDKTVTRTGTGKKGDPYLYSLTPENAMNAGPTIYRDQHYQNLKPDLSDCSSDSYSGPEKSASKGVISGWWDQYKDARKPESGTVVQDMSDNDTEYF